jgi:drug/metabolite transporter (DMT)-like permease
VPHTPVLLGIACISVGVVALGLHRYARAGFSSGVLYALLTGVLISAYTVVDASGARLSGSALGFAMLLTIGDGIATALVVRIWKGTTAFRVDGRTLRLCSFAGAMQVGAYWIAVWALSKAPMGVVSALRESSVLFVALISGLVLKEGFGRGRLLSAMLIFVGIVSVRAGA